MVRSLWTAATGMNAQQTNVDTIANNLANVIKLCVFFLALQELQLLQNLFLNL